MGKLRSKNAVRFLKNWTIPAILVLGCFIFINSQTFATPDPTKDELRTYLKDNSLEVGAESIDGYQQIYYIYDDLKFFVTKNQRNHTQPVVSGKNIAWVETIDGFPQIFLYDVIEKTSLQITQTGTNVSPDISGDKIVWEGLQDGVQQVFYYDGFELYRLSSNYTSLRPKIKKDIAVFAQYTGEEDKPWRVISYDLSRVGQEVLEGQDPPDKVIKEGYEPDSWPSFTDKGVKTTL